MFFSDRANVLIFLHRDSVAIHRPGKDIITLTLPENVLQNLEVLDAQKFSQILREFLTSQKLKGKRVLVLIGEEAAFLHSIVLKQGDNPDPEVADFQGKIPFDTENIQLLRLGTKDRLFLCGVNKAFYKPVVSALINMGNKVLGVVPAPAYGIRLSTVMDNGKLKSVLKDNKWPQIANLLIQQQ